MTWKALKARVGRIWRAVRPISQKRAGGNLGQWPADGEDALVPSGPPRKPPLAGAVALPLPEPEAREVDAYGRPLDGNS